MKCSDISARLVDLLYEEMPASERAEFSAHLAACPSCAAEVKASSRALQRTRTALRGPLNEDPPARVHASILAAAQPAPTRKPQVEEKEGFFARLWKAPWLLPAMGAASVATAVFLIKVIKNPEVLPVRQAENPAMVAKPQPAENETLKPAPAPVEQQAEAEAEAKQATPKEETRGNAGGRRERAASGAAPSRPASRGPVMSVRKKSIDHDPLMDLDVRAAPTPPEPVPSRNAAPSPKPAATAHPLDVAGDWAEPPPAYGLGGKDRRGEEVDRMPQQEASGAGASQPRGEVLRAKPLRAVETPSPAPAASAFALPPAPSAAHAKAAPAPGEPHARAKRAAEAEKLAAHERAMQDDLGESAATKEAEHIDRKGSSKDSFEERVRKADKLYSNEQWAEAAVAYRALLTQAPNHPSAPVWRQRLMVAEDAKSGKKLIKTKSKASDDTLTGP